MEVTLKNLYPDGIKAQEKRYHEIKAAFAQEYGTGEEGLFFSAPGRTEIGGNHTDHNHGRVLAAAINLDIVAMAVKTNGNTIRLKSAEYRGRDVVDLADLAVDPAGFGTSCAMIKGVCAKCLELGYQVGGFDAYTMTKVLKGSGLSSSAAFEVLLVTILSHLYNEDKIDPVTTALIAQYAENVYFGKPSGLLDQMAASVGGFTAIDFANPEKPQIEKVDFDFSSCQYALCVVDTGGNHASLTDQYAAIPQEMKSVAQFFGKSVLREVSMEDFYENLNAVRSKTGDRAVLRAMHFYEDDQLAVKEAEALEKGDMQSFLHMITASGKSSLAHLQNVFAPIQPREQGVNLGLALSEKLLGGEGACRVHGGGFAGTIQAFVPVERLLEYRKGMERVFGEGSCYVLSVRPVGGTKVTVG